MESERRSPRDQFEANIVRVAQQHEQERIEKAKRAAAMEQFVSAVGQKILGELNRLPSPNAMDGIDSDLYIEACRGIRSNEHLDILCRAIRANCRFRPVPAEFRAMVEEVIGVKRSEIDALGPAQRAAYQTVTAPDSRLIEARPVVSSQATGRERFAAVIAWQRDHLRDPYPQDVREGIDPNGPF